VRFKPVIVQKEAVLVRTNVECDLMSLLQKWFRMRNAQWRKAEGLPAELGSVKD